MPRGTGADLYSLIQFQRFPPVEFADLAAVKAPAFKRWPKHKRCQNFLHFGLQCHDRTFIHVVVMVMGKDEKVDGRHVLRLKIIAAFERMNEKGNGGGPVAKDW